MQEDLIIPVYVDTNALLDVLASIEGGFSVVEKITSQSTDAKGIERGVKAETGTEFGIPNVLSLLKLNLGYSANWKKSQGESHQRETERYHTYGSLFYRLREYLYSNKLVKCLYQQPDVWQQIQPSDFVEIRGIFRPNPFANSLQIIDRLIGVFQILSTGMFEQVTASGKSSSEEKRRIQEQRSKSQQQTRQMEDIRKFFHGVLADLQAENIRAFVVDMTNPEEHKAVVFLFLNYLRDQTLTEISYKEYRLLGKVVRKIETRQDSAVDLLQGTGLGGIGKDTVKELVNAFSQLPGMNLPEIETEIRGPVLEIIPIAVFV